MQSGLLRVHARLDNFAVKVIGLLGPSGSGKTTLAHKAALRFAQDGLSCAVVSIATPIKRDLARFFCVYPENKDLVVPLKFGSQVATTYREACQFYGDLIRKIDPDSFIREMWHAVKESESDVVIVDDLRTHGEVLELRANDAEVILIRRPELIQSPSAANAHPTERYAHDCVKTRESELWTPFDNNQPLDLSAQSLYESIRHIRRQIR